MRIAVAGATSTLGLPVVAELTRRGHTVIALTRRPQTAGALPATASVAEADVHDLSSLRRVLIDARPDAVVSLLIQLPRRGPWRWSDFDETIRLWDEGVPNLLTAADVAGAHRVVAESVVFAYGYGASEHVLEESSAVAQDLTPPQQRVLSSLRRMEHVVGQIGGAALRFGAFRGPAVPTERLMVSLMRKRLPVIPGGGHAILPFVHLGDAARAVADAVEAPAVRPLFNIADDDSAEFRAYAAAVARAAGTPAPRSVPAAAARLAMPYTALVLDRVRLRVSNALAARELGWRPAAPTPTEPATG